MEEKHKEEAKKSEIFSTLFCCCCEKRKNYEKIERKERKVICVCDSGEIIFFLHPSFLLFFHLLFYFSFSSFPVFVCFSLALSIVCIVEESSGNRESKDCGY